ncbi:MAG: HAMP domain-containing protein, partial [Thermodesulfobacteriota bacterium]|nr:HAMP domain-containing protein [Thermodesulfobacteriota bacterium]
LRGPLGTEFDRFLEIIKDIEKGDNVENSGYYLWKDQDGVFREKFMAVTPVEGTKFGVAATVYLDEFTRDIKKVERMADKNTRAVRNVILATLGITLLVMALIVFFYAHRITERIQNLTDVAERISVGEMDAEIKIETNDEIGTLAEAIGRMQDSIRLSIERLRRRR